MSLKQDYEAVRLDLNELLADYQRVIAEKLRLESELSGVLRYATQLCVSMAKAYPAVPEWSPLPDAMGVLSQIDNMWVGFRKRLAVE